MRICHNQRENQQVINLTGTDQWSSTMLLMQEKQRRHNCTAVQATHTWQWQPKHLLHQHLQPLLAPQPRTCAARLWVLPHTATQLHSRRHTLLQQQAARCNQLEGRSPLEQLNRLKTTSAQVQSAAM